MKVSIIKDFWMFACWVGRQVIFERQKFAVSSLKSNFVLERSFD